MRLLPSGQQAAVTLPEPGEVIRFAEPCDCGDEVSRMSRMHQILKVVREKDKRLFRQTSATAKFDTPSKWEEVSEAEALATLQDAAANGWYRF